jgi:hypothetical protein
MSGVLGNVVSEPLSRKLRVASKTVLIVNVVNTKATSIAISPLKVVLKSLVSTCLVDGFHGLLLRTNNDQAK